MPIIVTMYRNYRYFRLVQVLSLSSKTRGQQRWIAGGNVGTPFDDISTNKKCEQKENDEDKPVDRQILETLTTLKDALKTQLRDQNKLLKSIDARLGRIEKQERGNSLHGLPAWRPPSADKKTVAGSWKFLETPAAEEKRKKAELQPNKHENRDVPCYIELDNYGSMGYTRALSDDDGIFQRFTGSYGRINDDGLVLAGEFFPPEHYPLSSVLTTCPSGNKNYEPNWSHDYQYCRAFLPQLVFNNKSEISQKSGIYSLDIIYNKKNVTNINSECPDAGIIIGEMEFNSHGAVMAQGADWDRLLNNLRQTQLPYANDARGTPTWLRRKISEPWQDGDVIKFRVDTDANTIIYQRGASPQKMFWNVLAFTNNRKYPEFLRVYAYCGEVHTSEYSRQKLQLYREKHSKEIFSRNTQNEDLSDVKLTIV